MTAAYAAAMTAAAPLLRAHLRRRAARGKEIPDRLGEREGLDPTPRPDGRMVWLHAASVGETMSLLPVLSALDDMAVLVTTGTVTAARLLAARARLGPRLLHRFAPLDVPAWVARFLDHWRPDAMGFVESELWPAMLAAARLRAIPAVLINARLSARSARRWRWAPGLARAMLGAFRTVLAQSEADAARFAALGARAVSSPGNLKLAAATLPADPAMLAMLREALAGRPAWAAASTHPGEEHIVAAVHRLLAPTLPGLVTVIVPRHPERGPAVAEAVGAGRHGAGDRPDGLWVLDTLGDLGSVFRICRVTLMGNSLLPPGGGQNVLEPARLGCALAVGPRMANFLDAVGLLSAAGAIATVDGEAELAEWVGTMLRDTARADAMGEAARDAVRGDDRALDVTVAAIRGLVGAAA